MLYCIVLYCIKLYCIVLYCIVLYCIKLFCTILYCTVVCVLCYTVLPYTVPLNSVSDPYSPTCLVNQRNQVRPLDQPLETNIIDGGCSTDACTGTWTATISALPLIYAMLTATGINGLLGIAEIGVRLR